MRPRDPAALAGDQDPHSGFDELRTELLRPLAVGLLAAGNLWVIVFSDWRQLETWLVPLAWMGASGLAWWLGSHRPRAAAALLVAATTAALGRALWIYPDGLLACFLSLVVLSAATLLGPRSALATAALSIGLVGLARRDPAVLTSDVALVALLLIWATAMLSWLGSRSTELAVAWAWYSYSQARVQAEQLRQRQGELGRALKSLLETHVRLEEMNADLERARRAAEEARRLKAEFAASISHELRTPLNLIIGFSEMMAMAPQSYEGERLPRSYRGDVEAIYRNACHLSNLVDDVLDLSQIEAGRMGLRKEPSSVSEIADEAVAAVATLFEDKGLTVCASIPDSLPPVQVDRTRVRQVLINLLSNAARFTEEGGVRISARQEANEIVVAVADTGAGIAPEELPRVFEEFHHLDGSLRRRFGRSGLGLSISKRFVELHGGWMRVESEVGQGTTFHFSLPLRDNLAATARPGSWHELAPGEGPRPTVVVVGEDARAGRLFQRYLDGYRVLTAAEVRQGERLARQERALALLIVAPAGPRSLEGLRRVQESVRQLPAIICSLQTPYATGQELGVAGYLMKPVSREQLRAALQPLGRGQRSILVVDDDPEMVRLLARMVGAISRRYQVITAFGGADALALLRQQRPDAVLLDLLMPEPDGYAVLEHMRADPDLRETPVVVITAKGLGGEAVMASLVGVTRPGGLAVGELMRHVRASLDALVELPDIAPGRPGEPVG